MRTLITEVRVFDGSAVVPSADVLIEDGVIASALGEPDIVVSGAGRTLLPGLIDSHVHDGDLSRGLRHGVTTELDMFCLPANLARQRRIAAADYLKVVAERGSGQTALKTIAHALSEEELRIALDAGVDGIAHVFYDVPPGPEMTLLIARILAREVFFVSTLAYIETIAPDRAANAAAAASALHRAGVPLLAGTDANLWAPAHGDAMHRELELLVAAGLSPVAALAAATSLPAKIFGLIDRGRIAPGLRADLLLVEGNPAEDITATGAVVGVWRRGVRL